MVIVHIVGLQCSGKSYVIEQAREQLGDRLACWDVADIYRTRGGLNRRAVRASGDCATRDLRAFLRGLGPRVRVAAIESSGANAGVNGVLSAVPHTRLVLHHPPDNIVRSRAIRRGLDPDAALRFNRSVRRLLGDLTISSRDAIAQVISA